MLADTPTLSMSPSHGGPGTSITLSGTGFLHSASVSISFGGVVQAGVATDNTGSFTAVFPAPNDPPGTYNVTAKDAANTVSLNFKLDPSSGTTSTTTSTTTTSTTTSTSPPTTTTTPSRPPTSTTTETQVSTVFVTATQTIVSPSTTTVTVTTPGQPSTSTQTQTQTQTETRTGPASTVYATSVVTPGASTVTVTVPGGDPTSSTQSVTAGQNSLQLGALSDAELYFFAGVGILILAVSLGILAFRHRVNNDYGKSMTSKNDS